MVDRRENKYPTGSRVVCRSNEDEPLMIGTLEKWEKLAERSPNKLPFVRDEATGELMIVMGVIRLYDEKLIKALNKLTYAEQWNVLAEFGCKRTT
jgi:hypothetical protein